MAVLGDVIGDGFVFQPMGSRCECESDCGWSELRRDRDVMKVDDQPENVAESDLEGD